MGEEMGLGVVGLEGESVPQKKQHQSPSRWEGKQAKSGQMAQPSQEGAQDSGQWSALLERTDGCTRTAPMCPAVNCHLCSA